MSSSSSHLSRIGLVGLAVMGQNLSLNIAEKGFDISVYNRSNDKIEHTVKRAHDEKVSGKLRGFKEVKDFVHSIAKPRPIIILVQAGKAVDETIEKLLEFVEAGDIIIDGGNEWYVNTERRGQALKPKHILYMGMGVSGGEEGARHGPSLMPGGPIEAYNAIEPIVTKIAAQVSGVPCVTYIGEGGAGNYVKMVHNGIEYGDMQLIAEAYDILKNVGGLSNEELSKTFKEWNSGELQSFLIEITYQIFTVHDDDKKSFLVDKILDKSGMKGTGKWTVQESAENAVPCPTVAAALDARCMSGLLEQRRVASTLLKGPDAQSFFQSSPKIDKAELIKDVRDALYASKICSYAQGMNLIKEAAKSHNWKLNLGNIAKIWKGGCIIRAIFLDRIKKAYDRDANLASLLVDPEFAAEMNARQANLRKVVALCAQTGIAAPAFSSSLAYYDQYRRVRLPANLIQAQRDYFGAHTFERLDKGGAFHAEWSQLAQK